MLVYYTSDWRRISVARLPVHCRLNQSYLPCVYSGKRKNVHVNVHKQGGHGKRCTGTWGKSRWIGARQHYLCLVIITWLWGQSEMIMELAARVIIQYLLLNFNTSEIKRLIKVGACSVKHIWMSSPCRFMFFVLHPYQIPWNFQR